MTTTENTTSTPAVQLPEVKPAELIQDARDLRHVRVSFNLCSYGTTYQEKIARMGPGGLQLESFCSHKKSKIFHLSPEEMDTLAQAWTQYRQDYFENLARVQAEYDAEEAKLLADCQLLAKVIGVELKYEIDEHYTIVFPPQLKQLDEIFSGPSNYISLDAVQYRLEIMVSHLNIDVDIVRGETGNA